jgi:hypothetical protein
MQRGGGAEFFPPKDKIRLHGGETFGAGQVQRFFLYYQQRYLTGFDFEKNEPVPSGVAMSELSNGIKKHTSKSHETIPLSNNFT